MEAIQREQHAAYMRDLRQSREYQDRENKLRILGLIKEGAVPHVYSLTKYNITRDYINDLRRRNGFAGLIETIPYWVEATRRRRRTWTTLRVTSQKLLQRSPRPTFQTA